MQREDRAHNRPISSLFFLLIVSVLLAIALGACTAPVVAPVASTQAAPAAAGEPTKGGTLVVARRAEATLWDPKFTNDNDSLWAQVQIFATLLQNSPDGKSLTPYLAESYEVSPDATQFTFKLRDNAKFCDGTPVTSEDVKFSLERAMEEDSAVSWQYPSNPKIEAPDPLTVNITLDKSNVAFPSYLTLWGSAILSKAYVEKNGEEAQSTQPLGSGAFCLAEWKKGEEIVLKPNPGYWEAGKPYVDEVQLKAVGDDNARVLQVQSGDVDIALDIPYNQVDALSQSSDLKVGTNTLYGTAAIVLNQHTVPQFTDKKVRQAMNRAIDRQAIVNAVLFGKGEVAKSPFYGPDVLYWTGDFGIPFNLDEAKALMAESGSPDGFPVELTIASGDSLASQTAVILKDQLAKLNIDVTITPVDPGAWWDAWSGGKYQMLYKLGTNDVIDPAENIPFDFWPNDQGGASDSAFTGFRNDEIVTLSKEAEATLDPEKRRALYYDLQKIAMDESPQLWLFHPTNRWATTKDVEGFSVFNTGLHRFWEVSKNQ